MRNCAKKKVFRLDRVLPVLGAVLLVFALALCPDAVSAYAETGDEGHLVLTVQPNEGTASSEGGAGVSDFATDIKISKLAADNHDTVSGAHLQILDASTGEAVCDWWTDGSPETITKTLDVDTDYVLREVEAPAGFEKADDVTFSINAYDGELLIKGGNDAGQAEVMDKKTLALYDTRITAGGEGSEVRQDKTEAKTTSSGSLADTGDRAPIATGALALAGLSAVAVALFIRHKSKSKGKTE